MRAVGVTSKVDNLGQVVLPMSMRRVLGIETGSPMEISKTDDGEIVLKPQKKGTIDDLCNKFHKKVCENDVLSADAKASILDLLKQIEKTLESRS